MADKVEVYQDGASKWRWRKLSEGNSQVIATSGESFDSKRNAREAARRANTGDYEEV